jgi:F-box protein 11
VKRRFPLFVEHSFRGGLATASFFWSNSFLTLAIAYGNQRPSFFPQRPMRREKRVAVFSSMKDCSMKNATWTLYAPVSCVLIILSACYGCRDSDNDVVNDSAGSSNALVHASFAEELEKAEPGATIYLKKGLYQYEEPVRIEKNVTIIGEGEPGETVLECTTGSALILLAEHARIESVTLRCVTEYECPYLNDESHLFYSLQVLGGESELYNCDFGDGSIGCVYIRGEGSNPEFSHCRIRNSQGEGVWGPEGFYESGGAGVKVVEKGRGVFTDCEIYETVMQAVIVETGGNPTFSNCKIHDSESHGVWVTEEGFGEFVDCEIYDFEWSGVYLESGSNPIFTNCVIRDGHHGVEVLSKSEGVFTGCVIQANDSRGVGVEDESNPTFVDCEILDNVHSGVALTHKSQGTFTDCSIQRNGFIGVWIESDSDPTFTNCEILESRYAGIDVSEKGLGAFAGCEIRENGESGVETSSGGNPTLEGCRINGNVQYGVHVFSGGGGSFIDCDLTGNGEGAWDVNPDAEDNLHRTGCVE